MLRALTALPILLAIVAGAAPASGAAKSKPHRLATNVEWVAVDGSRYAAWGRNQGPRINVLDTRTHKRRTTSKPGDCSPSGSDRAMVGGWLLMYCGVYPSERQALLNVRTGRSRELPRPFQLDAWSNLGTRFIGGTSESGNVYVYFNRRTGHIRKFPYSSNAPIRDLDDPKLRPVCTGLDLGYAGESDRFYDRRYLVTRPPTGAPRFVLRRRCKEQGRILVRSDDELGGPFVASGWVSWSVGPQGYIENLRTRKRRHWRIPHYRPAFPYQQVGQTRNTAFFAPPQADDGTSAPVFTRWDVYAVGL